MLLALNLPKPTYTTGRKVKVNFSIKFHGHWTKKSGLMLLKSETYQSRGQSFEFCRYQQAQVLEKTALGLGLWDHEWFG